MRRRIIDVKPTVGECMDLAFHGSHKLFEKRTLAKSKKRYWEDLRMRSEEGFYSKRSRKRNDMKSGMYFVHVSIFHLNMRASFDNQIVSSLPSSQTTCTFCRSVLPTREVLWHHANHYYPRSLDPSKSTPQPQSDITAATTRKILHLSSARLCRLPRLYGS
jgi:hypothetical protein